MSVTRPLARPNRPAPSTLLAESRQTSRTAPAAHVTHAKDPASAQTPVDSATDTLPVVVWRVAIFAVAAAASLATLQRLRPSPPRGDSHVTNDSHRGVV